MSVGAEGLRVIEIGDLGEVAGKLLADAGADAIRVEPPSGSGTRRTGPFAGDRPDPAGSLRFAHLNTSKRGVTLDLQSADGRALWWRLVAGADAVIDAAGHGVLDALEAGWEAAAQRRAGEPLVWCSVAPFGRTGPWAGWVSNDLVQIALGGPMMSTGYDDHELPPIRGGYDHSLWMAGAFATVAVLAARQGLEAGLVAGPELVDLSIHEAVSCTDGGRLPELGVLTAARAAPDRAALRARPHARVAVPDRRRSPHQRDRRRHAALRAQLRRAARLDGRARRRRGPARATLPRGDSRAAGPAERGAAGASRR